MIVVGKVDISIDAKKSIEDIFINIFLLAVTKKLDLAQIATFVDETLSKEIDNEKLNQKYLGLVFVKLLSEEMNVSIDEIMNDSQEYRQSLIQMVIADLSMDGTVLDIDNEDENNLYITYSLSGLRAYDKTAEFIEEEFKETDSYEDDFPVNEYLIEVEKNQDDYVMTILTNNLSNSEFISGRVEVWREKEGFLAEYIEEAFEENLVLAFKEGVCEDELLACVFDDTRTIRLLDKFEGFEEENAKIYHRLVIKNGMRYCSYNDPYIHLVIERRSSNNVTGDITFTEFKQGEISDLRQHVIEELDQRIIEGFCDKNQFYRFNTGYLLRAQNSKNRSGYGWVWNWKNGKGTYVKGTEYGETTDYVFVGAYISTSYIFDSMNRKPMMEFIDGPVIGINREEDKQEECAQEDIEEPKETTPQNEVQNDDIKNDEVPKDTENQQELKPVEFLDVEKIRENAGEEEIRLGSIVTYKKIERNEIIASELIGETKLLHKKMLGKKAGEMFSEGSRHYLVISVENN